MMFIRTRRLLLRPLWPEDVKAIHDGLNDWEVIRWMASPPWPYLLGDARHFIELVTAEAPLPIFAIVPREPEIQKPMGVIGLHDAGGVLELGYWLARSLWGQGLISEAAEAVLELGFLGLGHNQLIASYRLGNKRSSAVLERKLGFELTCIEEGWSEPYQSAVDYQRLRLTRAQWLARRGLADWNAESVLAA
jgi:RimJ/RimL family protein N-acetyltransferase